MLKLCLNPVGGIKQVKGICCLRKVFLPGTKRKPQSVIKIKLNFTVKSVEFVLCGVIIGSPRDLTYIKALGTDIFGGKDRLQWLLQQI